ncbi:hypothetical protein R4I99_13595 [Brachyspira intermedia]
MIICNFIYFQARFYLLNTQIENVTVTSYLKVAYNTALQGGTIGDYTAETFVTTFTVNDGINKLNNQMSMKLMLTM